jgi:hypothetical protein
MKIREFLFVFKLKLENFLNDSKSEKNRDYSSFAANLILYQKNLPLLLILKGQR